MTYYIIEYLDGRVKSGYFWTDGEAWQYAKDYSKGYSFKVDAYEDPYDDACPPRLVIE